MDGKNENTDELETEITEEERKMIEKLSGDSYIYGIYESGMKLNDFVCVCRGDILKMFDSNNLEKIKGCEKCSIFREIFTNYKNESPILNVEKIDRNKPIKIFLDLKIDNVRWKMEHVRERTEKLIQSLILFYYKKLRIPIDRSMIMIIDGSAYDKNEDDEIIVTTYNRRFILAFCRYYLENYSRLLEHNRQFFKFCCEKVFDNDEIFESIFYFKDDKIFHLLNWNEVDEDDEIKNDKMLWCKQTNDSKAISLIQMKDDKIFKWDKYNECLSDFYEQHRDIHKINQVGFGSFLYRIYKSSLINDISSLECDVPSELISVRAPKMENPKLVLKELENKIANHFKLKNSSNKGKMEEMEQTDLKFQKRKSGMDEENRSESKRHKSHLSSCLVSLTKNRSRNGKITIDNDVNVEMKEKLKTNELSTNNSFTLKNSKLRESIMKFDFSLSEIISSPMLDSFSSSIHTIVKGYDDI